MGVFCLACLLAGALPGWAQSTTTSGASSAPPTNDQPVVLETFRVEGYREGLAKARQQQREAPNLKDILSVDSVGKLPDSNLAEALQRTPGVYLQGTHGDGRYVSVRGVDPNLNNVTVNGATIAVSDVDGRSGRAAPLDIMGANAMSAVEVVKVPTPDMDAQGLGATINIISPSAYDHSGPFLYGSTKVGVNDARLSGVPNREADLNLGTTFGPDKQFGLMLGLNYLHTEYNTADVAWENPVVLGPGFNDYFGQDGATNPFGVIVQAKDMSIKEFLGVRERRGATANLEWRPGENTQVWLRGYYTKYHETLDEAHLRLRLGLNPARTIFTSPDSGYTTQGEVNTETTSDDVTRPVSQIVLGGKQKFGDGWTIDGDVNFTKAREEKPGTGLYAEEFTNANYKNGAGNVPSNAAMTFGKDGFFPVFNTAYNDPTYGWPGTGTIGDLSFYPLFRMRHEFSQVEERTQTYDLNLQWDRDIAGRPGFLKAGVKFLDRKKSVDDKSMRYEPNTTLNGGPNPNIFLSDTFNGMPYGRDAANIYGGFPTGPAVYARQLGATDDPRTWEAAFDEYVGRTLDEQWNEFTRTPDPATAIKNPDLWHFREEDSASNSIEDDYDLQEKITAAYLMGNYKVTPAVNVIAGARVERTKASVSSPLERDNPDGTFEIIRNGPYDSTFTSVLPDALVRWEARDNLLFRASFTSTVGRPDYIAMAPKGKIRISTGPEADIFTGSLSVGNPDLKSYKSSNVDLSTDYYLPNRSGVIRFGFFYKDIKNPIYAYGYDPTTDTSVDLTGTGITRNTVNGTDVVDFQGVHFSSLSVGTQLNADSGWIRGFEFTYQNDFKFLPEPFDGFGVSLNVTSIKSHVTIFSRPDDNIRFFRQPNLVENFEAYYEKNGLQARLGWHFQGDALAFIGSSSRVDEWLRGRGQLDARLSYRINQGVEIFAEARNLNDAPYRTFWGFDRNSLSGQQNDYPGYEYVGRTYSIGLNYFFGD